MTPEVLQLVETLRAAGQLKGNAFRVALDAAFEAGCRLRVTSNRKVNVKKGNRRGHGLTIFEGGPRFIEYAQHQRPPEALYAIGMDALSPENGFTFMGQDWDSDRIFRE